MYVKKNSLFLYKWFMKQLVDIFYVNVLINVIHFVLKIVYVPFGNCKYYVSIFYKVWVVEFWTW